MAERRIARTCAVGATAAVAVLGGSGSARTADAAVDAFGCRVSSPTGPIPGRPSFNFGNRRIAVVLPPRGTFVAVPENEPGWAWLQKDGWIRTKIGWWSARGTPRVSGRRLDGASRPLRVDIGPLSWSSSGSFYPSLLYFSSLGCWKITAMAGGARLDAFVRVVRR